MHFKTFAQANETDAATSETGVELQDVSAALDSSSSDGDRHTTTSNEEVRKRQPFANIVDTVHVAVCIPCASISEGWTI